MTQSSARAPARPRPLGLAFAALVLVLVATVGVSYAHFRRLSGEHHLVARTVALLAEREQLQGAALEMESAFRGFALTGDSEMVERWEGAREAFAGHLAEALRLADDDAAARRQLVALGRVQSEWSALQEATGLLEPERRVRARIAAADPRQLRRRATVMDSLLTALARVGAAEEERLRRREARTSRLERITEALLVAGGLFSVVLAGGLAVLVARASNRLWASNGALAAEIAERRQAQRAVERLSREKEMILDAVVEGIYGCDVDGYSTFLNPAGARMLKLAPADVIGRPLEAVLQFERGDGGRTGAEVIRETLQTGEARSCADVSLRRVDGAQIPVEFVSAPLVEEERLVGAVVTLRDVTEQREVARIKDEFVSVVSHELRTPLTALRGSLGLLASGRMGAVSEAGTRLVEISLQNTDRLVRLVNDILDLERIAAGEAELQLRPHDAAAVCRDAAALMEGVAERAGVPLRVEAESAPVCVDADRILQVLTNLLSNAVKFSPRGEVVTLRCRSHGDEARLEVADRGRGIPPEKLETIFERFQQVDSSDSRDKGGTGLGLAIARSIVQKHGGRIWAASTPGGGSVFHIVLPLAPSAAE